MLYQKSDLTPQQLDEFKVFISQQLTNSRRKLNGNQMCNLKRQHFNDYIRKIKFYAKKDSEQLKTMNQKQFYDEKQIKNYENKPTATSIINRQKPPKNPLTHQPSVYYYEKAEISSLKQFIFLAEECRRIQQKTDKFLQRRKSDHFVKMIQKKIQSPSAQKFTQSVSPQKIRNFSSRSNQNLRLTYKSARQIDQKLRMRRFNLFKQQKQQDQYIKSNVFSSGFNSEYTKNKSLGETNISLTKNNSLYSGRMKSKK